MQSALAVQTTEAEELAALWVWLIMLATQGEPAEQAPLAIHAVRRSESNRTGRPRSAMALTDVIGGPAFSRSFESYLGDQTTRTAAGLSRAPRRRGRDQSALRLAMKRMHAPGPHQSFEYRIVNAVVDMGYRDRSELRQVLGCNETYFNQAALGALRLLRDLLRADYSSEHREGPAQAQKLWRDQVTATAKVAKRKHPYVFEIAEDRYRTTA